MLMGETRIEDEEEGRLPGAPAGLARRLNSNPPMYLSATGGRSKNEKDEAMALLFQTFESLIAIEIPQDTHRAHLE